MVIDRTLHMPQQSPLIRTTHFVIFVFKASWYQLRAIKLYFGKSSIKHLKHMFSSFPEGQYATSLAGDYFG